MESREMFKERWYGSVGMAIRLLNLGFDMGVVPMGWRGACIVPLYKGKGDKCEYLDTWSGFEAAKTAPWQSRGLHTGKFLEPSDE